MLRLFIHLVICQLWAAYVNTIYRLHVLYVRHPINEVTKRHHSVNFWNMKNSRYTFCRELSSEYKLWVSLLCLHCDVSYKHCCWTYPARNSVLLFVFCGLNDSALMPFTLRYIQCVEMSVLQDQQYMFSVPVLSAMLMVENVLMNNDLPM